MTVSNRAEGRTRYCGNTVPPSIIYPDGSVIIQFASDASVTAKGFKLHYQQNGLFFLKFGAMHFIYQKNMLTTTKVDSTYSG